MPNQPKMNFDKISTAEVLELIKVFSRTFLVADV